MFAADHVVIIEKSKTRKPEKRQDIQGLRGISIIAVILFHCRPDLFPHGYLGVDVFFIISGYLIAGILSHGQVMSEFYSRRFLRIVPAYAAMLLVSVNCAVLIFAPIDFTEVATSTKWCMIFARNLQQIHDAKNYWAQASEFSLLLHTWSLGVEIQFYLAAPLLHYVVTPIPLKIQRIILLLVFIAISLLLCSFSYGTTQFYSLHCRFWQFLIGFILAQFIMDKRIADPETPLKLFKTLAVLLIVLIIAVLVGGFSIGANQMLVSISAALLILTGEVHQTSLLTNEFLIFIGDYSYELYLIHWPAIVIYQYSIRVHGLIYAIFTAIACILCFMILLKIYNDTNRSRPTIQSSLIYVGIIYAAIIVTLTTMTGISQGDNLNGNNIIRTRAMLWMQGHEFYPLPPHEEDLEAKKWTNYVDPKHTEYSYLVRGSGNLSILLLGNSFGFRASPVIAETFATKFRQYRVFTELGCPILTWQSNCTKFREAFLTVLERMKPDITWVVAREPGFFLYSDSKLHEQVSKSVRMLKAHSKCVVIDGQSDYYGFTLDPRITMIRRLQLGNMNFSDLQTSREDHNALHRTEWKVMNSISDPSVLFNNVSEQMCDSGSCPLYSSLNLHNYYGDRDGHMNQEGLERLRSGYETVAREAIEIVRRN